MYSLHNLQVNCYMSLQGLGPSIAFRKDVKSMAYAIIGIKKLKEPGNIAGMLSHMTRQRHTPNSNGMANDVLIQPPPFSDIMAEINSYLPRKNAVRAFEILLTSSSTYFEGKTENQIRQWQQASLAWACQKFGRQNVKAAICHRDETTPHISLLIIPEHEGKLNARYYTGGKAAMRKLWTEYAAAMKPFGLERGREHSPAKHQDIKDYYAAVNAATELAKAREIRPDELPAPELLGRINPQQYAAGLINRAAAYLRKENAALRTALKEERQQRQNMAAQIQKDRELFYSLQDNPEMLRDMQKALQAEAMARAKTQQQYASLAKAIGQYFQHNIEPDNILRHPDKLGPLLAFPEIQDSIRINLSPEIKERRGMTRTM